MSPATVSLASLFVYTCWLMLIGSSVVEGNCLAYPRIDRLAQKRIESPCSGFKIDSGFEKVIRYINQPITLPPESDEVPETDYFWSFTSNAVRNGTKEYTSGDLYTGNSQQTLKLYEQSILFPTHYLYGSGGATGRRSQVVLTKRFFNSVDNLRLYFRMDFFIHFKRTAKNIFNGTVTGETAFVIGSECSSVVNEEKIAVHSVDDPDSPEVDDEKNYVLEQETEAAFTCESSFGTAVDDINLSWVVFKDGVMVGRIDSNSTDGLYNQSCYHYEPIAEHNFVQTYGTRLVVSDRQFDDSYEIRCEMERFRESNVSLASATFSIAPRDTLFILKPAEVAAAVIGCIIGIVLFSVAVWWFSVDVALIWKQWKGGKSLTLVIYPEENEGDERFVIERVIKYLEVKKEGRKLRIPNRDFLLGSAQYSEFITSMDECTSILFVLSKRQALTPWVDFGLIAALEKHRNVVLLIRRPEKSARATDDVADDVATDTEGKTITLSEETALTVTRVVKWLPTSAWMYKWREMRLWKLVKLYTA